ncbi:MAG: hypothetical protein ABEJ40_02820 [Haloarculaceae archaeon]
MSLHGDTRAARNVIGLTLTFSVIIVSVGLTATVGYQQLDRVNEVNRIENAEEGMKQVTAALERLQQGRSVVATTELNLGGGTLAVTDGAEMTVRATRNFNVTFPTGGLAYRLGETSYTYESGALFRTDRNRSVMIARPTMSCTKHQAVVSVVTVRAQSAESFSGGVVTLKGAVESSQLVYPLNRTGPDSAADAPEANVTVSSPRAGAWSAYFAESGSWTESAALEDTYVCDGVDAVYVRRVVIEVSFLS